MIVRILVIPRRPARALVQNIVRKLGVRFRLEATAMASTGVETAGCATGP
ncbi:MAG: hypothetical protein ACRDYX_12300 [Egibacteraceae bacterium]